MDFGEVEITKIQPPLTQRKYDLKRIKRSLSEYGQRRPVVISSDGVCVAGWGVVESARALGWDTVVAETSDKTYDELESYRRVDNDTAEMASWDTDLLREQLIEISDDVYTGFTPDEIADIVFDEAIPPPIVLRFHSHEVDDIRAWFAALVTQYGADDFGDAVWCMVMESA